jgi:hypothetical protein
MATAALLALSGCGGSSLDGTYYDSEGSAGSVKKLVIDGDQATYTVDLCKGPDEGATSRGELNEDGSVIVWGECGDFVNQSHLTATENRIQFESDKSFVREGQPEVADVESEHEEYCQEQFG